MKKTFALMLALLFLPGVRSASCQSEQPDLTGLWEAQVRFDRDVRGPLTMVRTNSGWHADIAGFVMPVLADGASLSFVLPGGKGSFRGTHSGREITGHWIGPEQYTSGRAYATPIILTSDSANRWRGEVRPLDDPFTFFMPVSRRPDGTYKTFLRNPERNQGRFLPVSSLQLESGTVKLMGRQSSTADTTLTQGRYDEGVMRVVLVGSTFDFRKAEDASASPFYPRPRSAQRYAYSVPLQLDDGWPVASVEDVGISRTGIETLMQMLIDLPMDSLGTSQIHSLLIARHGKLVVEEYFHGYHRDKPHDTRSAAKSWTSVLLGAAMQAGVPITVNTPVYETMLDSLPAGLDPRKRAMTLEHLISMTAGYDCGPQNSPGNEGVMQNQTTEPDWYRYTLNVPLVTAPGDTIVYCDSEPNLAAGVLRKIAGQPLTELFYRLVAQPMQMSNYHLQLSPTGEAYGGGGHRFLPRDYLKLAQLMVNDGKWNDRQIISSEWARQSGAPLRNLTRVQQYGWLWNSLEYPYKDGTVRAFFAGGNGGQIFMGIPELELVIAFTGGNYNDPVLFIPQRVFVPNFILPAVH